MLDRVPLLAVAVAALMLTPAAAQVDLAKSLVGTWEGEIDFRGLPSDPSRDPKRTLVIQSVTDKDGTWVARGRFGITGKTLGTADVAVDPGGPRPSIAFTTPVGLRVRLQLVGARQLDGTIQVPGAGLQGTDRPMKLIRKE